MHEDDVFRAELEAHLADGLKKGERFDVADGAADFDENYVDRIRDFPERGFNFVGDVRDDLDGFAEIIAAAFLGNDGFVDAAGGPVMIAREMRGGKTLVVAEIEIGFRTVVSDKHFAVLIGRHGAGINVQIGIALLEGNSEAPAFEQATYR